MNLIKIEIENGVVTTDSKKLLGEFFRKIDGGCMIELFDDERVIAVFNEAAEASEFMATIALDDSANVNQLLKARLDLSMVYSRVLALASYFEGLHDVAYQARKRSEAENFLHHKNTVAKASDNAATAFSVIASEPQKAKEIELKRLFRKTKSLADGIEQKLNSLAGLIKNSQNDKDRNM